MQIKWYGHSCFRIVANSGISIVMDPFDERVGYYVPSIDADIITISHDHYDHNNTAAVRSEHVLVNDDGDSYIKGIKITGFRTFHDDVGGAKRGDNIIFNVNIDGAKICHLGDLGHEPDEEIFKNIKDTDILLIPVGGTFTINSDQAYKIATKISPKIIIPMHYKTDKLRFDVEPVDNFIKYFDNVSMLNTSELVVNEDKLISSNQVIVFSYA